MTPLAPHLDLDLGLAPLLGDDLHLAMAAARTAGPIVRLTFYGQPAYLLTRFSALKEFLLDQAGHPGGVIYQFQVEQHVGRTFISMDGPDHDTYRQLATPAFRSRATARFIDRELTPLAHEVLDRLAPAGQGDLASGYAQVLPFWAISRKLGLPFGSEERQRALALALLSYPRDPDGALAAAAELTDFLRPVVEERRAEPRDDVISRLLTHEHNGVRFTDDDVFAHVRLLYAVGATTTSDGLSTALHTLLTRPGLLDLVSDQPELLPRVVHESLRCEPPVSTLPRVSALGGGIAGVDVEPGSIVLCGLAAANRDPAAFEDPDRFDPHRPETEILTFGFGAKFCPGMHLARQQILAALEVVLDRLPGLEVVAADPPTGGVLRRTERIEARWSA